MTRPAQQRIREAQNRTAMESLRFAVSSNGSAQPDVAGHGDGMAAKSRDYRRQSKAKQGKARQRSGIVQQSDAAELRGVLTLRYGMVLIRNAKHKNAPPNVSASSGATGQISPQDIVSVLIVARKKGKGNEEKAGIQDYLGHAA